MYPSYITIDLAGVYLHIQVAQKHKNILHFTLQGKPMSTGLQFFMQFSSPLHLQQVQRCGASAVQSPFILTTSLSRPGPRSGLCFRESTYSNLSNLLRENDRRHMATSRGISLLKLQTVLVVLQHCGSKHLLVRTNHTAYISRQGGIHSTRCVVC